MVNQAREPLRMPADKAYLALHGRQWRVEVFVPRHLRAFVGKAKLVVPLKTDSLALANRDKHKHVHALKQEIARPRWRQSVKAGRRTPW